MLENIFFPLERYHQRLSRGKVRVSSDGLNVHSFLAELKVLLNTNLSSVMNYIRISLSSMKKSKLKQLFIFISNEINEQQEYFDFLQWYLAIINIIESKLYTYNIQRDKVKKLPPKNICKVYFDNKAIEVINLSRILRDKSLKETLPSTPTEVFNPTVTYKLSTPIASTIFNFKKFVENLDIESYLKDKSTIPCFCHNSPFADPHHRHIVTGNLKIVTVNKLRKILSKGPKFRESQPKNFDKAMESIVSGLEECVSSYCSNNAISRTAMIPWLYQVKKLLCDRVNILKSKMLNKNNSEKLRDPFLKKV